MHEMKQGELTSGRSGKKVTNPKQAIAIGLSEARHAGADVPPPPTAKKGAKRKPVKAATKKTAAKKKATKKKAVKATKKAPAKKKATAKKGAAKKKATKKR